MDWEELKEEAKKMGALIGKSGAIYISHLQFEEDGGIYVDPADYYDWEEPGECICISSDRTPDEMFAIMKALL